MTVSRSSVIPSRLERAREQANGREAEKEEEVRLQLLQQ